MGSCTVERGRRETEVVVEQAISGSRLARFRKEIHAVPVERGAISLVRKRAEPGVRSRGTVLLLHGYAQNRYAWHLSRRSLVNYLAEDGFDVFNADLRGVGRSRALGSPRARGFADYVEDVGAAVYAARQLSGEERVFLVGHSLGGALACAFAGLLPAAVSGVVTIAGLYDFARRNRFVRLLGRAARALESFGVAPLLLPDPLPTDRIGELLRISRAAWDSALAATMPLQAWRPGSIEPEVLCESIRRSFEPAPLGVTMGLARMALGGAFADRAGRSYLAPFERSDVPLLVLVGSRDLLVSPEDSAAAFDRSRSRDRSLIWFDERYGGTGFGHMDMVIGREAPRHVWPALRDWLRARSRIDGAGHAGV